MKDFNEIREKASLCVAKKINVGAFYNPIMIQKF